MFLNLFVCKNTFVAATVAGQPTKVTSMQDAKIKQLFKISQVKMQPFIRKLANKDIIVKTNAEIEIKRHLLRFLQDFMRMTGEKKANNVLATLQQPQYKNIADFLAKIGLPMSMSSSSGPANKPTNKPVSTPSKNPVSNIAPATNPSPAAAPKKVGRTIPENVTKITYKEFFGE